MMLAGLTGGMACGKSFVARIFAELGANAIEADELGHRVLEPDGEAYAAVISEFGPDILDAQERIDRSLLAGRVFSSPEALTRLNSIVHPAVRNRVVLQAASIFAQKPGAVVIYAAAILIESGGLDICNKIVVVSCTRKQQIERAMERSKLLESEVLARLARQLPLEEKLQFADFIIDAAGTKENTVRQTKLVYEQLVRLSAGEAI